MDQTSHAVVNFGSWIRYLGGLLSHSVGASDSSVAPRRSPDPRSQTVCIFMCEIDLADEYRED